MRMTTQQGLGLAWLIEHEPGRDFFLECPNGSPWIMVDFPNGPDKYVIWNATGSVYRLEHESGLEVVPDDPIYAPPDYSRLEKSLRAMEEADRQSDAVDALIRMVLQGLPYNSGHVTEDVRREIEAIAPGRLERLEALERVRGD